MALDIGRLDNPIRFLVPTVVRDGTGATSKSFTRGPVVWASYSPITTRDRVSAPTVLPISGGSLTLRYGGPIDHAWRVELNGETFKIVGVSHFGRGPEFSIIQIEKIEASRG